MAGYQQAGFQHMTAASGYAQPAAYNGRPVTALPTAAALPQRAAAQVPDGLTVTGCVHPTIGGIVRGQLMHFGENHGRPVYKKDAQVGGLDVMLYFWDERDGANFCGWWFGPKIGGDQVWAFHPNKESEVPPSNGWRVPYNGEIDPSMVVTPAYASQQQGWRAQPQQQQVRPAASPYAQQQAQQLQAQQAALEAQSQQAQYAAQQQALLRQQQLQQQQEQAAQLAAARQAQLQQQQQHAAQLAAARQAQLQVQQQQQLRLQEQKKAVEELRLKQLEDNRKRIEEANNKRKEEQQRKLEEAKKAADELRKKREEEQKVQKELAEKRALEVKAAAVIRSVLQKLRVAVPSNFDALKKQLEEVTESHLGASGSQAEAVKAESEKALALAQKRVDDMVEAQRKQEEKKVEEEKKRLEREERAKELLKELSGLLEVAEGGVEKLKETAAKLDEPTLSVEEVDATVAAVNASSKEVLASGQVCTDFFTKHHSDLKDQVGAGPKALVNPKAKAAPAVAAAAAAGTSEAASAATAEIRTSLADALRRTGEIKRQVVAILAKVRTTASVAKVRAVANARTKDSKALFDKYDNDCDARLSRKELTAFSKGEYAFELPAETLDLIWRSYVEAGDKGVSFDNFVLAKVAVGVAREARRDKRRKVEKEAKEKATAEIKLKLQEEVKEAAKAVSTAEQAVDNAEKKVQTLSSQSKTMSVAEMIALADEVDESITAAKDAASASKKQFSDIRESVDPAFRNAVEDFLVLEEKKSLIRLGRMDRRLERTSNLSTRFREEASKKREAEIDRVRAAALRVLRYNQHLQKVSTKDLFSVLDTNSDGVIDFQEFIAYFDKADKLVKVLEQEQPEAAAESGADGGAAKASAAKPSLVGEQVELPAEDMELVFRSLCDDGESSISKAGFARFASVYMKVVKETALTGDLHIKDSRTVRRLEVGEVVEVLEGPVRESEVGVMRVLINCTKDDSSGWASVAGNQGTLFLEVTSLRSKPAPAAKASKAG